MTTPESPDAPLSVRALIDALSRLDDQGGAVGVALVDRSGALTIRPARRVGIHRPEPASGDPAGAPTVLIVVGEPRA